jgi:hypothetical protein
LFFVRLRERMHLFEQRTKIENRQVPCFFGAHFKKDKKNEENSENAQKTL